MTMTRIKIIPVLVLALLSSTLGGLAFASDPAMEGRFVPQLERSQVSPEQLLRALARAVQEFGQLQSSCVPTGDAGLRWQMDAESREELSRVLDHLVELAYDALTIGYWEVLRGESGALAIIKDRFTFLLQPLARGAVLPGILDEFGVGEQPPIHTYIAVQHARLVLRRILDDLEELSQLAGPLVADLGVAEQIFEAIGKTRLLHHYSCLWVASLGELSFRKDLPLIPKPLFQRCEPLQLLSRQLEERVGLLYDDFMQSMPEALNALPAGICPQLCRLLLGLVLRTLHTLFLARSLTSGDWSGEDPGAFRWRLVERLSVDLLIHVRKWVAGLLAKTAMAADGGERWWQRCLWGNHPWASWGAYILPVFREQTRQVPPEWLHDLDNVGLYLREIATLMEAVPSVDQLVERILELRERLVLSRHSTSDDLGYFLPREGLLLGALQLMAQPEYAQQVVGGRTRQISDYAAMVWRGFRLIVACDLVRSTAHEARWGLNNVICCLVPHLSIAADGEEANDEANLHLLAGATPTGGRSVKSASRAVIRVEDQY